ncbi:MAG: 2TM domain-containing protein [Thermomicrobiales bacterium]|nr:2TM domain-containing protein [Thermomicrobiales bacterium]
MGRKQKPEKTAHEKRVDAMKDFIQHLTAYIIVIGSLMVLNIATGPGDLWFLWVAFFWGIGLAFHAVDTFMGDSSRLAKTIVDRIEGPSSDVADAKPTPHRPTITAPERAPSQTEISAIIRDGQAVVDRMRHDVRTLPQNRARRDAMLMVSKADEILLAIEEQPDEVLLARDFLNGLLKPIGKLLTDYSRLAVRDVPSAQPTLREVEEKDFPALITRLDAVYERLHRGSLIDLEVAREMMALDTPVQAARVE